MREELLGLEQVKQHAQVAREEQEALVGHGVLLEDLQGAREEVQAVRVRVLADARVLTVEQSG